MREVFLLVAEALAHSCPVDDEALQHVGMGADLDVAPARRRWFAAATGLLVCGLLGAAQPTTAQEPLSAKPEKLGLSRDGLAKIGEWMRADVAAK